MNESQRISDLLTKYLSNTCNQEEFDEFIHLIRASDRLQEMDEALKLNWERARTMPLPYELSWDEIKPKKKLFRPSSVLKYAAVIAIASVVAFLLYNKLEKYTKTKAAQLTAHTTTRETKTILLEDGTKVTLNSNTELVYPQVFNGAVREVYLKGEAYFQVKHDEKKSFIVRSGKLKTQVLGTTFTVTAYRDDQPMNVSVLTGKVSVKDETKNVSVVLTRGQSASTNKDHKGFKIKKMSRPEEAISWTEDKLIFDDLSLADCAIKLGNTFGTDVKIEDKTLADKRITAIFQDKSLLTILNAITRLTHTQYKQQDSTYIIYCRPQ